MTAEKNGRRGFLKAAGVTIAGTLIANHALAAGLDKVQNAKGRKKAKNEKYDVVVVGAGFAGLVAARDCALRGLSVLLLEARNRIGGRTFTTDFHNHRIELGGTWIHPSQPFVWSEVRRYALGITESPGVTAVNGSWFADGTLHQGNLYELFPKITQAFNQFCDIDGVGGRTVFPRPYEPDFNHEAVAKLSGLSLTDRLAQVDLDPSMRDLVNCMVAQTANGDPSQGSFVDQLHWYAICDYDLGMLFDRCGHFKIAEGMSGLAHAILQDADVELLLSAPVDKIENYSSGVRVTTRSGQMIDARSVICTLPMNCLADVEFTPRVSPVKTELAQSRHVGRGIKVYAVVKQKIGIWLGLAPYPNDILVAFTEHELDDGTLMVLFVRPDAFDPNDKAAVQKALSMLYPGLDVIAVTSYHWAEDPYSKGTWVFHKPGTYGEKMQSLRAREGNVHFASGDTATGWHGCVDGALQSGVETAKLVADLLTA